MSLKEREKAVICVSGMAGSGKSTLGKRLARKYGLKYLSGGNALKSLAVEAGHKPGRSDWWETEEGKKFLQQRARNLGFDKRVDEKLLEWAEKGDVVLDSWTMPWLLNGGFKIWLEVSPEERAKRIARRDHLSPEEALESLKKRDEETAKIYARLYGFKLGEDFSPFNLVLDTNDLAAREVFQVICLVLDRLYFKAR